MAQTSDGKKKVPVPAYKKTDGTQVKKHERSTPKTSKGKAPVKTK